MYTELNGRVWSTEENYLKNKSNDRKILKASLALENYADCNNRNNIYNDECFVMLNEYYKNKPNMSEQQLLETTSLLVEKFDLLFNKIGRDNFIFYDDGDINFIWKKN